MAAFMFDLWKSKNECGIFLLFFALTLLKVCFLFFTFPHFIFPFHILSAKSVDFLHNINESMFVIAELSLPQSSCTLQE